MNLKVPGAILPLGCAILSTRAITVRGGWYNPPLGELGLIGHCYNVAKQISREGRTFLFSFEFLHYAEVEVPYFKIPE